MRARARIHIMRTCTLETRAQAPDAREQVVRAHSTCVIMRVTRMTDALAKMDADRDHVRSGKEILKKCRRRPRKVRFFSCVPLSIGLKRTGAATHSATYIGRGYSRRCENASAEEKAWQIAIDRDREKASAVLATCFSSGKFASTVRWRERQHRKERQACAMARSDKARRESDERTKRIERKATPIEAPCRKWNVYKPTDKERAARAHGRETHAARDDFHRSARARTSDRRRGKPRTRRENGREMQKYLKRCRQRRSKAARERDGRLRGSERRV